MDSPTDVNGFWAYFWHLLTNPNTAPALTIGFVGGLVIGYLVLDRFHYKRLFELERANCDARVTALKETIDSMKPFFDKFQEAATKKIFHGDKTNPHGFS